MKTLNKTKILSIILGVVTIIFIALVVKTFLFQSQGAGLSVDENSKVSFDPISVNLSEGADTTTSDIVIDTGGAEITGVQIELNYDPKAITNVQITQAEGNDSLFGSDGTVLFNEVDEEAGIITYAIAISPGGSTVSGNGKIATVTFNRGPEANDSSAISFQESFISTQYDENLIIEYASSPLEIVFE